MKPLIRHAVLLASASCIIAPLVLFPACSDDSATPANQTSDLPAYEGKKILYINSYHKCYEWSNSIRATITETLVDTGVELNIHHMDTKRNTDEPFIKHAALEVKAVTEEWNPDVVITSDDNAFKYLVMPCYSDSDLPFVHCVINWDASVELVRNERA
jgi:hypothetical protein